MMSSSRRLVAAAATFLLALSAFAVPACEVDPSTGPRPGRPEIVRHATPPVADVS
jgi:hypothetical protein